MNVIYVGSVYPPGKIDELKDMGSTIDFAAETFQSSLLQGLCSYYPNLKVITAPNITAYPRIKKVFFPKEEFVLPFSGVKHLFAGFFNILGIKHLSKCLRIRKAIKKTLDREGDNTIIVYGVHSPFLLALCGIKRSSYKSCLIVPDLPEFMSGNTNRLYLLGKKVDGWLIRMGLKKIDSYVLFSPHMKERLPIGDKPNTHMEGIFNAVDMTNEHVEKEKYKTILYTGNISRRMGIPNLIEAFRLIPNPDYRLWIRGNGECKGLVLQAMKEDSRIVYFDPMPKSELFRLQKKATVLINPVFSSQTFTRYFFPSKTMEYLASGTPTIMARLACLPQDYESHLFFLDDESVEGIKNKIIEVCEKTQTELDAFGKAAAEFILTEKNEHKQAGKIFALINSIKRKYKSIK